MARSYRGLGLLLLVLLVVSPLTLFAVLSVFEDESADSIRLSLDGVRWDADLQGTLLASAEPWDPGESRSVIVYVRNDGPAPVDAEVVVDFSSDRLVSDGVLTMTAEVDDLTPVGLEPGPTPEPVEVDDLGSGETVPFTVIAVLADTAPVGTTVDDDDLELELSVTGTRTDSSDAPSLLDATGAQLWLAPILLVAAAGIALVGQRRRAGRGTGTGS